MYKEILISTILLVTIFIFNFYTSKFTQKSIDEVLERVEDLEISMMESKDETEEKYKEVEDIWEKNSDILSYYIEHNELEKINSNFSKLYGSIKTKQIDEGIPTIENCKFILEHIKEKEKIKLRNIF